MTQNNTSSSDNTEKIKSRSEMGLMEHLKELRTRLVYVMVAMTITTVIAFCYSSEVFELLTAPFKSSFQAEQLIGTGPAEAFILKLKTAVGVGLVLASPIIFWQIWLFIAPGLYQQERKLAFPFIFCTSVLFLVGLSFAYKIVLPFALDFFKAEYTSIGVTPAIRIGELLPLIIKMLLGFGLVFNLPVLAFFLGRLGIIDHHFLLKYFRHATVVIFIVAAVLTPPDVVTQFLMAIPLVILYLFSILVVKYTAVVKDSLLDKSD